MKTVSDQFKFKDYLASSLYSGFMSPSDKAKLDAFGAASTYALKSDIASMYKHKGSVATLTALDALTGMESGDVYNVAATGMNYVYVDATTGWDAIGQIFTIEAITNAEIDAIFAQ